jgi:hypothetical protein
MKGFNSLELFFKKDFVKKNAKFLISTESERCTVKLYSWDKFFIEQYFDNEHQVIIMVVLVGKKDLDKYLKEISISDLGLITQL